jgi:glycosyltransferase involved in cell wall biosynthesis
MIICSPQYGLKPNSNAGGEVYDEMILKGLADLGAQIEIILPYGKPYDRTQKNWRIRHIGTPYIHVSYLFNIAMLPALIATYRQTKFDILRVHSPYLVGIGAWLFKILFAPNVKLVATYFHFENKPLYDLIDRILIKKWDFIITLSESTKNVLMSKYGISEDKILLSYPGISTKYSPREKDQEMIKKFGPENRFVLSFCGIFIPRKNIPFLLDVIKKMNDPAITLVIVGDGPEKESLVNRTHELGIQKNIVFTGYLSENDKIAVLRSSDLFVFPSLMEGFGMAPAEAMACGIPTIVSDRGSLPEMVSAGGISLELDVEKWAQKIAELKNNENLRRELSQKALVRSKNFSWQRAAEKIEHHYKKLL